MKTLTKLNIGLFLGTLVAFGGGGMLALAKKDDDSDDRGVRRAWAEVAGPGIHGVVTFRQEPCPGCPAPDRAAPKEFRNFPEPLVTVDARVRGLSPGAHGFHIHENGSCEFGSPAPGEPRQPFGSAGAHFDPSNPGDVGNRDHPWHMGELDNLVADKHGRAHLRDETNRVTLSPGPLSVFDPPPPPPTGGAPGSAIVIHAGPDMGQPTQAGGARIACGVIKRKK